MLRKAIHRLVLMTSVVALMAGCRYDGMVSDLQEAGNREDLAISFADGFADNPLQTRSTVTRHLSDLDTTMGVWGWFVDMDGIERRVFNNQLVKYGAASHKWTYLPEKYWQQDGKDYKFCAYAPHGSKVDGADVTINLTDTMINITGITLKGCNTMSNKPLPMPKGINTFINVDDTDWMIDRKIKSFYHELITFNMQHILAKLIVTAKSTPLPSGCFVVIDSLSVGDFVSKADFTQKRDHTPDPTLPEDAGVNEWTLYPSEPRYTLYSAVDDTLSPNKEYCMIESLLLPQDVTPSQELFIYYSVHISDGHIQHSFESKKLDELFDSFSSECAYRIQLTIDPGFISFQTGATKWVNLDDYEYLDVSHDEQE